MNNSNFNAQYFLAAQEMARSKHKDQKYGEMPYFTHLVSVDAVAVRFGWSEDYYIRAVCFLHDIVEDTDTSLEEIEAWFGKAMRNAVDALTNREGESTRERFGLRTQFNHAAVLVKMFDRIANVEACLASEQTDQIVKLLKKYCEEHELFDMLRAECVGPTVFRYLDELITIAAVRLDNLGEDPRVQYPVKSQELKSRAKRSATGYTLTFSADNVKVHVPIDEAYKEFGGLTDSDQAKLLDIMGDYLEGVCLEHYDTQIQFMAGAIKDHLYPRKHAIKFITKLYECLQEEE